MIASQHPAPPTALETPRLFLRRFSQKNVEAYDTAFRDSFLGHLDRWWLSNLGEESVSERRVRIRTEIATAEELWELDQDYRLVIERKSDGAIIGQIGLTQIQRSSVNSAALGYWIARTALRQGFATEATIAGLYFAFENLLLHRVTLAIEPENVGSIAVARKLGLRNEGLHVAALHHGDQWVDVESFAITEHEWEARKSSLLNLLPGYSEFARCDSGNRRCEPGNNRRE